MNIVIAILLIVHGLIVAAQSSSSFSPSGGVNNPHWLNWWPVNLGRSWLYTGLGVEQTLLARATGILWLAAGVALIAAGLGVLGILVPSTWWPTLAVAGSVLSLFMLAIYLHPLYGAGIGASAILLIALLWGQPTILDRLGL